MKEKLREKFIAELCGIEMWQIYNKQKDVDFIKCMGLLLEGGADPNLDLLLFTPLKPNPIFHSLRDQPVLKLLIKVNLFILSNNLIVRSKRQCVKQTENDSCVSIAELVA
jgi:hypothetical protein